MTASRTTTAPTLVEPTQRAPHAEILAGCSTDDEASSILDELSKLQTLLIMQARHGPVWSSAADLVQRTRILIIERCKRHRHPQVEGE